MLDLLKITNRKYDPGDDHTIVSADDGKCGTLLSEGWPSAGLFRLFSPAIAFQAQIAVRHSLQP